MNNKYSMPKYDLNILKHINEHYKISFKFNNERSL